MRTQNMKLRTVPSQIANLLAFVAMSMMITVCVRPASAQTSATKTFASAEAASNGLFQAAQSGDEQQLEAILGAGKELTSSGDDVQDKLEREQFTKKYQEMHRLVKEADGVTTLYIGAENWPFPIPLVSSDGEWRFDADAGKQEILFRTIGENESAALLICDEFLNTKKQVNSSAGDDDPITAFAQKLASSTSGDSASTTPANDSPFYGYYFESGKKAGRVALIAYPADYRSSGVMTFLVTQDGVVYEKDLGPETSTVAPNLKVRQVDSSWHPAQ